MFMNLDYNSVHFCLMYLYFFKLLCQLLLLTILTMVISLMVITMEHKNSICSRKKEALEDLNVSMAPPETRDTPQSTT